MNNYQYFLIAAAILFLSCKRELKTKEATNIDLLTHKPWRQATLDNSPELNPKGIQWGVINRCSLDDVYRFTAAGTVNINTGDMNCSEEASNQQNIVITYSINKEGSRLYWDEDEYQILELNSKQLKIYSRDYSELVIFVH